MGSTRDCEVSGDCILAFRGMSQRLMGTEDGLFRGELGHLLGNPARFKWDELLVLYERMERAAHGRLTLEECGEQIFEMPALGGLLKIASIVTSPTLLYMLGNKFGLSRTFNHLQVEQSVQANGQIRITVRIPDEYADSARFYRLTAGVLRAFPRMLGLPDARVELELRPRFGVFVVTPPPSITLWARISRTFRAFFLGNKTLDELNQQQQQLNAQFSELKVAYAETKRALEVKRRFLSLMSHELRTPLNGIMGAAVSLRHEESPEGRAQLLAALESSAGSLSRMVAGVLDFAQSDQGPSQIAVSEIDLEEFIHETASGVRERAAERGLRFAIEIAPQLPSRVRIDGTRLSQIIDHLLDNAVKFTPAGQVLLRVRGGRVDGIEGEALIVEVADTGVGIRAADHQRIFELFVQLDDSSTRSYGGTGFGLALCERAAKAIGGCITVESAPKKGSTFTVIAPYGPVVTADMAPKKLQDGRPRALVVDDNRINRMVLGRMLTRAGFEVDEAEDGRAAVERVREADYDVVFMDLEMPVMDGLEATETLRSEGFTLPIVATTAYVSDEDRQACADAGMDDFLGKPVSPKHIENSLAKWRRRSSAA